MKAASHAIQKGNRRGAEAEARLHRMLVTAERMFIERGYAHTSLDAIVREAGGSKSTLIKYFGHKAGLLTAVFERVAQGSIAEALAGARSGRPPEVLGAFGASVLGFYLRHDSLAIYRSVVAEAHRHPALARAFYRGGHEKFVAALAAHLRTWRNAGLLRSRDPQADANRFLHLLRSNLFEPGILGLAKSFKAGDVQREVDASVSLFLHGIATPARAARGR